MIIRILLITMLFNLSYAKNVLQEVIDEAKEGSVIELPAGVYSGNIVITKPITIIGDNKKSNIKGEKKGTVIQIKNTIGVKLKNLKIINSGSMHQSLDSGIVVHDSEYVEIENCIIEDCLFGIDFQNTNNSKIIGNKISSYDLSLGLRGDGVRLWYSTDNEVKNNRLIKSRDMVIWYGHGNIIEGNYGEYCRYSLHFMYTGANVVKNNTYYHNSVGIFFMYSRDTVATGNVVKSSLGATGMGIGLKEVSNFTIKDNTVIYCAQGFFIDWSPYEENMPNTIEGNNILYNSEGIHFHNRNSNNNINGNNFIGNMENIVNDTKRADVSNNGWDGNYWDDYEGFDRDKDGIGDTPYISRHYADKMWLYNPNVKFFYGSPVISIINFLAKLAPFSEPIELLRDKHPRMNKNE